MRAGEEHEEEGDLQDRRKVEHHRCQSAAFDDPAAAVTVVVTVGHVDEFVTGSL